jgi:hypothetical protein
MAHIEAPDNNNDGPGMLGKNFVREFLTFMETDYNGEISKDKSKFHIAIRALLKKKPYAMDIYQEFIKTSKAYFPSYDDFVEIIDNANKTMYFIYQSHDFCIALWGDIHH